MKKVIEEYGQGDGTVPESCQGPSKSTRIYNIFTLGPQFEAKYGSLSDDLLSKSLKIPQNPSVELYVIDNIIAT